MSDIDLTIAVPAVLAAFVSAIFHAVGGVAGGLLLAICLAPLIGVKESVPVTAVAMIIANFNRAWLFRHHLDAGAFLAIFCTSLPLIVLSAVIYVVLTCDAVIADRVYDAKHFHDAILDAGATPVIPPRPNRRRPHICDWALYKERNLIERFFNKLKHFRRIATRYDKLLQNFIGFVTLGAINLLLR